MFKYFYCTFWRLLSVTELLTLLLLLGRSCLDYQTQETKSSLSKTLEQVLHDTVVLPYFIQFMELRRMEHLVKFWLEAESFHSTTWSRIRAHSLNTVKQSSLAEPVSPSKKHGTTAAFVTDSLDKRVEDSSSAQLEGIDLNNRTSNTQNHLLLSQECDSAHSLHLEMARTGAHRGSMETQESSRLTVASRNSPSSPLKELSGKLMKSKCVIFVSLYAVLLCIFKKIFESVYKVKLEMGNKRVGIVFSHTHLQIWEYLGSALE